MTPFEHALLSVRDFKGSPEDYLKIHEWLDQTKAHYPDWKHRAILHNSFGMILAEAYFQPGFTNSDGKYVSVREILRRHIIQDLGFVPTVKDWLQHLKPDNQHFKLLNSPRFKDLEYLRQL